MKKKEEAIKIYGEDIVEDVLIMITASDPDGLYNLFQDQGMDEHAECVEFLYFEN